MPNDPFYQADLSNNKLGNTGTSDWGWGVSPPKIDTNQTVNNNNNNQNGNKISSSNFFSNMNVK